MTAPERPADARGGSAPRPDRRKGGPNGGGEAHGGGPTPANAAQHPRRKNAACGTAAQPDVALGDLFGGLRAGDLESLLLTVAMAADENRMPSADPDEAARILGFLACLVRHDAGLPPPANGVVRPPEAAPNGSDAED